MKVLRWLLGVTVAAVSVVVLTPGSAYACSCARASVAQYVSAADVVVSGELTDADRSDGFFSSGGTTYTVEVTDVFKGAATRELRFESASSGSTCGVELAGTGRRYVFFLDDAPHGYAANLCGGTTQMRYLSGKRVEAVTGSVAEPSPGASGSPVVTGLSAWAGPLAIGAGLALVVPVGLLWSRMRRT